MQASGLPLLPTRRLIVNQLVAGSIPALGATQKDDLMDPLLIVGLALLLSAVLLAGAWSK